MPPEASSASTTSLLEGDPYIKVALSHVDKQLYPAIHGIVTAWLGGNTDGLYNLRRNGTGQQIVYTYPPVVYTETLKLYVDTFHRRRQLDKTQRRAVATVLCATGLINRSMLTYLFGVGRSTIQAMKIPAPVAFPLKRMGGDLTVDAVPHLMSWWAAREIDPVSAHGQYIHAAVEAGADWPVVARLTARTVAGAKKSKETQEKETDFVIPINHSGAAGSTESDAGGRTEDRRQSGAHNDFAGFGDEAEFRLVPASVDGGDAYKSAADLLAQHEANAGDAGQPDASETGFFAGFEGDQREREGGADRGTHPFLQP